jgi:transmembrane sensor
LTVATANLYPPVETAGKRPFRSRQPIAGWLMAAASAASILAAASFAGILADLGADWGADYRTAAGETSNIVLPDDSRVHLNSDTALSLDFDGGRRGVSLLKGEAWFEVAHDQKRPFTVAGGYSIVHVTGTSFDVSREDEADRVHLVTGRIYLTPRENDATSLHLTPGETAKADRSSISRVATADDDRLLAWRSGWIVLSGTPLREALAEIERYTDSRLLTLAPSILETPVSGSFRIENADDAIASVVTAAGGKIDHLPGGFIIIR